MYPFPHFRGFTAGTPTIPDIYWNCYTHEERIKKLCCEYSKLIAFVDSMVDVINSQYEIIEELQDTLPEVVAEVLEQDDTIHGEIIDIVQAYIDSLTVGTTYDTINQRGFVYKPGE